MCTVLTEGGAVTLGPVAVLKFGSSLLTDVDGFRLAAEEIGRHRDRGYRVLAVVSAMRGTTDRLVAAAGRLSDPPASALLSTLLRTGEDASVALLAMALTAEGVHVQPMSAESLGLRTRGPLHDAVPLAVDLVRLATCLRAHEVVVVPGFVGIDVSGSPSLLGRGGSDLTALFLAAELGAEEVRLVKDVDGVHRHDPRVRAGPCEVLAEATWDEVARIGNGVVQEKALRFARRRGVEFRVAALAGQGTLVRQGAAS